MVENMSGGVRGEDEDEIESKSKYDSTSMIDIVEERRDGS